MEFPHLLAADGGEPVRHDLPRALLLFLVPDSRADLRRARPAALRRRTELPTHGGSLRIYACHAEGRRQAEEPRVAELLDRRGERRASARSSATPPSPRRSRRPSARLLDFLIEPARGQDVAAYGAPGKGNTLLNYCGIRTDFVDYTVDRNPYKHGRSRPARTSRSSRPSSIRETRPDYVLILPWNLKDEITEQLAYIREWGGRFVVPIPRVDVS